MLSQDCLDHIYNLKHRAILVGLNAAAHRGIGRRFHQIGHRRRKIPGSEHRYAYSPFADPLDVISLLRERFHSGLNDHGQAHSQRLAHRANHGKRNHQGKGNELLSTDGRQSDQLRGRAVEYFRPLGGLQVLWPCRMSFFTL
jgi:hypothetical protein